MIDHKRFQERLRQLIAAPSVSCTEAQHDMSNQQVTELLEAWFRSLGFSTEIQSIENFPGKYNLIASYGAGEGGLVFSGHTDTVPYDAEQWQQDPFRLRDADNRFYGLGTTDMKGFFPTALAAIESIDLKNLNRPLTILATADEESSMCGARALSKNLGRYAVIGEPTGMKPVRMHKGIMMEAVRVQGQAGHSSNPALGSNALEAMHKVLALLLDYRNELQTRYQNTGFEISVPTLNLGCIHGGDNPNRICGHCELQFDLRPLPGMDLDLLHENIEKLVKSLENETATTITTQKLFPGIAAYEEPAHSEIVEIVERLSGHRAESVAFATEAPFLQKLGMQTVVMGPGSINQAHQPDEYLEHTQIEPAVNILKNLIWEVCS